MMNNGLSPSPRSPLLRAESERPIYDIRATERSESFLIDKEIIASRSRYLYCVYCRDHFSSKAGLVNHEKSHMREISHRRRLEISRRSKRPRTYTCKECGEQFEKRGNLNSHVKTHVKIIKCNVCQKTFRDRMDFEMHDAIFDGENYDVLNFPAHRTRSQSRLSCHTVVPSVRSASCDGNFYNGVRTPQSSVSLVRSTRKRTRSNASSISVASTGRAVKKKKSIEDWIENNRYAPAEYFSDASSVQSFALTSRSGLRTVSPSVSLWSSRFSQASFTLSNKFICSEAHCMKTFPNLNWVTMHEMEEHKKLALFRCIECRKRFTTSGNLQQHKLDTHQNVLICVLCDNTQMGLASIQEHFDLHQKYSVKCEVCGKLFLSKYYLDEHLKHKVNRHNNCRQTKAAILIRVDRRDTTEILDFHSQSSDKLCTYSYHPEPYCADLVDGCLFRNSPEDSPWRI